jgi:hypothetical protein
MTQTGALLRDFVAAQHRQRAAFPMLDQLFDDLVGGGE